MTRGWSYRYCSSGPCSADLIYSRCSLRFRSNSARCGAFTVAGNYMPLINPDFELNLATEFLSIFFTVSLDRLIEARKRKSCQPVCRVNGFHQVYDDCVLIWYRMLREAAPAAAISADAG